MTRTVTSKMKALGSCFVTTCRGRGHIVVAALQACYDYDYYCRRAVLLSRPFLGLETKTETLAIRS